MEQDADRSTRTAGRVSTRPSWANDRRRAALLDVFVRNGYAWVSSTYRRGGYGVRVAATDVRPQSGSFSGVPSANRHAPCYMANRMVAMSRAKVAELYALDVQGAPNYDGVHADQRSARGRNASLRIFEPICARCINTTAAICHRRMNRPTPVWQWPARRLQADPTPGAATRRDLHRRKSGTCRTQSRTGSSIKKYSRRHRHRREATARSHELGHADVSRSGA